MIKSSRTKGNEGEDIACTFLRAQGIRILDRNVKSYRAGELDIIARDIDGTLLFIEVKLRRNNRSGAPAEAVTFSKIQSICRAADYYRVSHGIGSDTNVRFDVIAISLSADEKIDWIKNAFDYVGKG